jgi:hypothetical protein
MPDGYMSQFAGIADKYHGNYPNKNLHRVLGALKKRVQLLEEVQRVLYEGECLDSEDTSYMAGRSQIYDEVLVVIDEYISRFPPPEGGESENMWWLCGEEEKIREEEVLVKVMDMVEIEKKQVGLVVNDAIKYDDLIEEHKASYIMGYEKACEQISDALFNALSRDITILDEDV